MTTEPAGIRLNKFISDTGVCSRREADKLIEAGRVQINGKTAALGTRVTPADRVTVNGEALGARPSRVFLACAPSQWSRPRSSGMAAGSTATGALRNKAANQL